jgi:hypothetical protein
MGGLPFKTNGDYVIHGNYLKIKKKKIIIIIKSSFFEKTQWKRKNTYIIILLYLRRALYTGTARD